LVELRHQGLAAAHRVQHVDLEVLPPVLLGVHAAAGADVRHEDVAAAEFLRRLLEPGLVFVGVAHVHRAAHDLDARGLHLADRGFDLVLAAGAQCDVAALGGEQVDDGPADPLGRTRDDRLLSAQAQIHRISPGGSAVRPSTRWRTSARGDVLIIGNVQPDNKQS
jgi:hypothetical protein